MRVAKLCPDTPNAYKKLREVEELKLEWYAVYTKPRWEKKVASLLEEAGIEHYCPVNKVTRQWSDRKKVILEPVFKGYVFVKLVPERKWEVKKIHGIINFVYWLGKPATIREEEIMTIKKFLNEFSDVEITQKSLTINTPVRIKQGIMMHYKGIVVEVLGNKAVVKIDSLDIQLSAHFDKKNLEIIN